jgi:hypothetical protein
MGWALVILGLVFVVITPLSIKLGKKSENWPQTQGKVISSEVEIRQETDTEGDTSTYYYPRIHYDYNVGGEKFQSSKYRFLDASMTRKKANELVESYSPGQTVAVYYDPAKPTEAVLITGAPKFLYVFAVIGAILIIAGLLVLIL